MKQTGYREDTNQKLTLFVICILFRGRKADKYFHTPISCLTLCTAFLDTEYLKEGC